MVPIFSTFSNATFMSIWQNFSKVESYLKIKKFLLSYIKRSFVSWIRLSFLISNWMDWTCRFLDELNSEFNLGNCSIRKIIFECNKDEIILPFFSSRTDRFIILQQSIMRALMVPRALEYGTKEHVWYIEYWTWQWQTCLTNSRTEDLIHLN